MFCNHCGTEIPDNSAFCTKCGMNIEVNKPKRTDTQPESADKSTPTAPSSDAIGAERSKIVLIWSAIIAVIAGIIGSASGVVFFGILCAISILVAAFSFVALVRYTNDIPDDERTKGQETLLSIVHVIYVLFGLLTVGFIIIVICANQNAS